MTVQTLERRLAVLGAAGRANRAYKVLVERFPPRAIASEREHRVFLDVVGLLMAELPRESDAEVKRGMREYLAVVGPFIEAFERARRTPGAASGRDVLAYLMEANGLTQRDLAKEIGKQPYVSDILSGRKSLTAAQIGRLARRFGVSPAAFFPA